MRNYQLRKTNNELTLKKKFFLANNKWGGWGGGGGGGGGGGWDYIYMYIRLCSLCFGVTLLIFQNSKKNSPKIEIN